MKRIKLATRLCLVALLALSLAGCKTSEKILYLQDLEGGETEKVRNAIHMTFEPQDQLSIFVNSRNPEIALMFNLPRIQNRLGATTGSMSSEGYTSYYTVDADGNIDFPELGKVHVAGLTKSQIAELLKEQILSRGLAKDIVVTVEFANLSVMLLGEVARPGKYAITKESLTLLEALSMAGDLTIYGLRENVIVVREEKGQRRSYTVDLRSKKLFDSPVYYLKQNDVVYVQPNKVRAGQSTLNENSVKSVSLWITLASFLTSMGTLLFK